LSITDHRVPKDTLKDKEKIKKEGKNTNTGISLSRSLKNQRKEKPVVRGKTIRRKRR